MTVDKSALKWGELYTDEDGNPAKHFPCHDGQRQVLESEARITAAIAGTGGGKTAVIPLWLMKQIGRKPDAEIICVSPNFKMLRRTLLKELQSSFEGTSFQGVYNETKWEYRTPTGARIYLYSADEPNSIQGVHADAAVIDECGMPIVKPAVFNVVRQRTNRKGAPILLTSTPYQFNWLYYDVYQPYLDGNKDYNVVSFSSLSNPTYSKEEFERERKRLAPWKFEMLYEGKFTRPDGLVYEGLPNCLIEPKDIPRGDHTWIAGLDFGFNDPMAALAGFVDDNCLYVVYEKYQSGKTVREFALDGLPTKPLWWCDSARPDSIKELRKLGFKARRTKKFAGSVKDNIDYVNGLIRTGRLKVVQAYCPNLVDEADVYTYLPSDKEGEYTDKPIDARNHACDALAYLAQGCKRMRLLRD